MQIFEVSKKFPREETYSQTDQIRRSSRSVCANLAISCGYLASDAGEALNDVYEKTIATLVGIHPFTQTEARRDTPRSIHVRRWC
ncbi:MAG: four helix bundle protein [Blastocatellia bacterium]